MVSSNEEYKEWEARFFFFFFLVTKPLRMNSLIMEISI